MSRLVLLLFIAAAIASAQTAQFVPMTPCRLVDTRDGTLPAAFGPPSMTAHSSRNFPIPTSACNVPSTATAYSINATVIPAGPLPYITVWPTGQTQPFVSTLNSYGGSVLANAAIVPAGTNGSISVYADGNTNLILDINGYFLPYSAPVIPPSTTIQQVTQQVTQQITQTASLASILAQISNSSSSLGLGTGAAIQGSLNTAVGYNALSSLDTGHANTALGSSAAHADASGFENVAIGWNALQANASGSHNVAVGAQALSSNTELGNTAVGSSAMVDNVTGQYNTAVGFGALGNNLVGSNNIGLGYSAGSLLTAGNNIDIGHVGAAGDAGIIRIGTSGTQIQTYIAGIFGTGIVGSANVIVNSDGKLGIASSSRETKEDIRNLTDQSDKLMHLRPVQFRYKQAAADGSKPLQFGLIAEEVDQIYPELVVRDSKGKIVTVAYQQLPALLLKQVQDQQKLIESLQLRLKALETAGLRGTK